ncbi:MAG: greA, partial [Chlamydiales bacterium]|nr:greA [Chlamydiales bacterium]
KDELSELVIPEKDWAKWWQNARSKLRKDTMTESPGSTKEPFRLRESVFSHEEQLKKLILSQTESLDIVKTIYQFARDLPDTLKNPEIKKALIEKLLKLVTDAEIDARQKLAIYLLLDEFLDYQPAKKEIENTVLSVEDWLQALQAIEIVALKKRALVALQQYNPQWADSFFALFFSVQPNPIREYLLRELNQRLNQAKFTEKIEYLLQHPAEHPELFIWYFQKAVSKEDVPFSDAPGLCHLFESFLILFDQIEDMPEMKDLTKKMYTLLSGNRYQVVRQIMQSSSISFAREFLLLVSKIHSLTDHDLKILQSLAEVVHPKLKDEKVQKGGASKEEDILWTTEQGYLRIQDRVREIGTIEMIDNAREIETARSHGDLRENSEYKFALERRSRLQGELKMLSDQLNKARILTKDDISLDSVGVGAVVDVANSRKEITTYTILGPWDADPDRNILSSQSRLAQAMQGLKLRDTFSFRGEEFEIENIQSYFQA